MQGMVTLALSTWIPGLQPPHEGDSANWVQNLCLYGSLYIVALGTGGIKPNVSAFGADQFDMSNPKVCLTLARSCRQLELLINAVCLCEHLLLS